MQEVINLSKKLFTSESVTEGHPDKLADQISDGILDAILADDPEARVAAETMVNTGLVVVAGEITTKSYVDIPEVVRKTVLDVGYTRAKFGFDGETCGVLSSIDEQSPDIAMGVDRALESRDSELTEDEIDSIGAGDQGMMFGYATNETDNYMPMPIEFAHRLTRRLAQVRKESILDYIRPDGKSQVTIEYNDKTPKRIDTVVVSTQHDPEVTTEDLHQGVKEQVITPVLPESLMDEETKILINPTGRFVTGGPQGDAGLTGRKIIVDTYGGYSRHGGGAFSGKDPTKVDRSGAYAARYVAKNVVAAGLADKCELQISYAIGVSNPVSVLVGTFNTNKISEAKIEALIRENFDLRPAAIIQKLGLRAPIYQQLASYGHMGRTDLDVAWEKTDKKDILKQAGDRH